MSRTILNPVQKQKRKIIGLRSGNSGNGFELVLAEISGSGLSTKFNILHTCHHAYSPSQKQFLLKIFDPQHSKIQSINQANFKLAQIWAETIKDMQAHSADTAKSIDLIGCQGPTVYGQTPARKSSEPQVKSMLQIGDPTILAQLTGIITIGDFYLADLAAGGKGRPLLPYLDWLFFSQLKKNILLLNIGDLTSCTYIPAEGEKLKIQAFDTGPGNRLIDQLMLRLYELPFDRDGEKARLGTLSEKLFGYLQKIDNFSEPSPPESLGQDQYGTGFVLFILRQALRWRIPEPDVIHTVSRYITFRSWKTCRDLISGEVQEVLLSGSGSHNIFIRQLYQEYFQKVPVKRSSDYDLPEDFREAICAAILANEYIQGIPANLPGLTGAAKPVILGKICPVNKSMI